uniref:TBP-like 1 n=1 Tax=Gasterosteus aculeatus aculeatus TaxID=481459 RepID=A0AAQ4PMN8_GASAC
MTGCRSALVLCYTSGYHFWPISEPQTNTGTPLVLYVSLLQCKSSTVVVFFSDCSLLFSLFSEDDAKLGARRLARVLQKLGFKVRFSAFKVVNVLAVCSMPFGIQLVDFTIKNRPIASYEPELHPAATYRIKHIKATVQVFSTGSITVTGPNVQNVATAVEQIYPLLFECRKPKALCK